MPGAVALGAALGSGLLAVARGRRRCRAGHQLSVTRARNHLRHIAEHPHPTGSPAAARVRDHLVGQLEKLGMTVRVESGTVHGDGSHGALRGGRIENVFAVPAPMPPDPDTPSVLLVAHYDSVPGSPGAADNGMGVAAVLEVARVLLRDGEHDFQVLFTDGEEAGLLGARAHVDRMSRADRARTVVVNLDARGNRGRPVVFEAGPDLHRIRPALAALVPAVTSLADAVYHRLPHDTDLTMFRRAGMSGINLGLVAGSVSYHTAGDSADRLDPRVLAALMADALAAVRALLAERRPASPARRATYFPAGGRLVSYPAPIDVVLGAGSLLATMALAADFRAVLLVPLPAVAAVAVGAGGWRLARAVQPYYGGLPFGDPYRPGPVVAGETAVLLAAGAALARWIARRVPAASQLTALQGWLGAAAVAAGVLLPGSGYLASWPAALATLCLMAERAYGRDLTTLRATLLGGSLAALALPAAALLQPALGLRRTAFPLALLATASSAVLPVLAGELKRCPATVAGALLAGGGVASIAIGLHRDRIDGTHPAHVGMCYMRDADGAYWLGAVGAPGLWQPTRPSPALLNRFPGASPSWARWRAAELLPVPEPTVRLSRPETTAGETALEFSVSAPDSVHATTVQLIVASADQPQVTVEGGRLPVTRSADGRWVAEVYFAASLREPLRAGVVVGSPRHVTVKATAHSRIPIEWATGPDACAAWTTGAAGEAMMVRALDIAW